MQGLKKPLWSNGTCPERLSKAAVADKSARTSLKDVGRFFAVG